MRLLFVGTNNGRGGTESHFSTLAIAMQVEGHEVAAVVRLGSFIHTGLLDSQVQIYSGIFRNAFDPRGFIAVWRAINEFKPDWIVGNFSKEYWPLAIIAKLKGIKLALFKHMDFPMRFLTHHFIPRLADRFIVISEYMRKNFIARGVAPSRIQLLYNPINLAHFHADQSLRKTTREVLGFSDDDIVLGYIGAMHPDKGMHPLCDALHLAMAELPNLKALWVGEGPGLADLKQCIQHGEYANRHVWQGWTPNVLPYFEAIDMLAMPTIGLEAFGRVSLEAQACGLPVLCSNSGGIPETFIPNETGLLLPPGDVHAWHDAILKMVRDDVLRNHFKKNGRHWVEKKFSTGAIAKEFTQLLENR